MILFGPAPLFFLRRASLSGRFVNSMLPFYRLNMADERHSPSTWQAMPVTYISRLRQVLEYK